MSRLLKASGLRQSIGPLSNSNTPCVHVGKYLSGDKKVLVGAARLPLGTSWHLARDRTLTQKRHLPPKRHLRR